MLIILLCTIFDFADIPKSCDWSNILHDKLIEVTCTATKEVECGVLLQCVSYTRSRYWLGMKWKLIDNIKSEERSAHSSIQQRQR